MYVWLGDRAGELGCLTAALSSFGPFHLQVYGGQSGVWAGRICAQNTLIIGVVRIVSCW